jgi:hypothetical protein
MLALTKILLLCATYGHSAWFWGVLGLVGVGVLGAACIGEGGGGRD